MLLLKQNYLAFAGSFACFSILQNAMLWASNIIAKAVA
ncbi:MAG: hypothetical protein OFPII_35350 [Osedax symbiont Rs1]|nr:MAG: hypothetical protein OFPII_35350 [Osedax symbiont Rs1]